MPVPALSPGHASPLTFPPIGRLPSAISAAGFHQFCSRHRRYYAAVRLLISSATASSPRLPVVARIHQSRLGEMRSPRFRRVPFIRNGGLRPRQSGRTSRDGAQRVAFDVINRLGLCDIISFAAQYPTPHDRCVRFMTAVTDDHATLATGRRATTLPWPDFHRLERASFAWRTDNVERFIVHRRGAQVSPQGFRS
jgi:hypothetical protein